MFDSVRLRLTLWYAGVLALSLIAFALVIYYAAGNIFHERQDESLRSTAQTVASAYLEELGETHSQSTAGKVVLAEITFPNRYVQLTDNAGNPIAVSANLAGSTIAIPSHVLADARARGFSHASVNGVRVTVVPLSSDQTLGYAAVAEPLSVLEDGLSELRRDLFAGVLLVLLLASAGGYFLARKSLAPVASMNSQTQRISAENLSARLDVTNPRDELGQLATTINDLLTRLENAFKEQQRFIADASHELRTPLAVLRGETEVALGKERPVEEYQQSLSLIQDEAERLSRIVEDLFILARQPINTRTALNKERVSLNDAVRDCARAAQVLAFRKGVRLKLENDSPLIALNGDEDLIKRMLLNLLDNAVKYTPAGGVISLALVRQNGNAEIVVRDTGIGIPTEAQPRVFDRFYRVDKARARTMGGAGLGLSIAQWIVEVHGGSINLSSTPGHGSTFTIVLPTQLP
ncbi:MAG TPA: heavy metal sensor histidine kinase [Pyrinomonadaceae bacterium]|nr:heavy metal sensor histidine kinase [Pyrinomonadaceae bacterium]